ncbi:hypothetical protein BHM03_00001866 [Ensete ventricosum]|nr:hypothetical protein BHM03_00001866 [Ensete ventricosum]
METVASSPAPSTVEEVFRDYSGRHCGLVRALTAGTSPLPSLCPSYLFKLMTSTPSAIRVSSIAPSS